MAKQSAGGYLVITFDDAGNLTVVEMSYTVRDDVNTELVGTKNLESADQPTGQNAAIQGVVTAYFNKMKTKENIP